MSVYNTLTPVVLEPASQALVEATANPPFLHEIVRPAGSDGTLPVILYMHGGGWVLGNAGTHDRLVRELGRRRRRGRRVRGVRPLAGGALPGTSSGARSRTPHRCARATSSSPDYRLRS